MASVSEFVLQRLKISNLKKKKIFCFYIYIFRGGGCGGGARVSDFFCFTKNLNQNKKKKIYFLSGGERGGGGLE